MLRLILESFCFILDVQLFIEEVFEMLMKAETSSGLNTPMTRAFQSDEALWDYYSATPEAVRVWPHDLCVAHGLVDAGKSAHGFLHHLLPHTEHVVLLEELIGELRHTQTGVDLLQTDTTISSPKHD